MNTISPIIPNSPAKIVEKVQSTPISKQKKVIQPKKQQVDIKENVEKLKSNKQLEKKVVEINKEISGDNKKIEYELHERTNTLVFKVYDKSSGDLIKEFPSEKILDMAADVWEKYGLIIDKEV